MKIHINYAAGCYLASQAACTTSALANGFQQSIAHRLSDIEPEFISANRFTFQQPRGAGYWLWKPYLIRRTIQTLGPDDWLMYTDSGMSFLRDPWPYILRHEAAMANTGLLAFGWAGLNREYTKRDTFVLMGLDELRYADGPHVTASTLVCRNTAFARGFLDEWIAFARDPRILTDLPNTKGLPDYPAFKCHRHDQSILSLLCMKHQIIVTSGITQWEMPQAPYIIHHRNRA